MDIVTALCIAVASLGVSKSQQKTACKNMPYIVKQSKKNNIDPTIVVSVMFVESGFTKSVVSSAGACGLMQLIPKWNPDRIRGKKKYYTCDEIKSPRRNIRLGVKALKVWLGYSGIDGDMNRALCAYNAGNKCRVFKKKTRIKNPAKIQYVKSVRSAQKKLHAAMGHKPHGKQEIEHCTVDRCPGPECPCVYGENNVLYFNHE